MQLLEPTTTQRRAVISHRTDIPVHRVASPKFDVGRVREEIQALCYPRFVGSPGERRAARYVGHKLQSNGLSVRKELFPVAIGLTGLLSRVFLSVAALLILLAGLIAGSNNFVAILSWAAAALLVNGSWRFGARLAASIRPRRFCDNIIGEAARDRHESAARVIFMAHYDTKSQFIPTGIRVALVSGTTAICGLLTLVGIAAILGLPGPLAFIGPLGLSAIAIIQIAGLMANYSGNRSPGALDNGSGIGLLLELARTWRPVEEDCEVLFVATGAEEIGLNGAAAFAEKHKKWFREKPTLLINLESVGVGPNLYLAGLPDSLPLARATADKLGIAHRDLHVLGAGMDHEPFAARGLPCVSILGDVVRKSLRMHTPKDNMSIIEDEALDKAARLAVALAEAWAARGSRIQS